MTERAEIVKLLHWYETPASGVIDHQAWEIAKPIIDDLMFQLASLDSGTKIQPQPTVTFFGIERPRYPVHNEVSVSLIQKRERMALAKLSQRKRNEAQIDQ